MLTGKCNCHNEVSSAYRVCLADICLTTRNDDNYAGRYPFARSSLLLYGRAIRGHH